MSVIPTILLKLFNNSSEIIGMRKPIAFMAVLACVSGCATFSQKWQKVDRGQSWKQVVSTMGDPEQKFSAENGSYVYKWRMPDSCSDCIVIFADGANVSEKRCDPDQKCEARREAARAAFIQGYFGAKGAQMAAPQPAFTPMPIPVQQQTNCTTNYIGGTAYTNCR